MVIRKLYALVVLAILAGCSTGGSNNKDIPLWNKLDKDSYNKESTLPNLSEDYLLFELNTDSLERNLNLQSTDKLSSENTKIEIPTPEGTFKVFTFEKSSVMSEKLAKKFPDLHSFKGTEVNSPSQTVRFEWTPQGFTAMFQTEEGQVFIQPYNKEDIKHYICYYKNKINVKKEPFEKIQRRN